jgi:stage IV sporulation protein FB
LETEATLPPEGERPGASYPPKPILADRSRNAVRRSVISLLIYGLLFYFIFEQNLAYVAAILIVILVHELGHFTLMRIFNYSNPRIFILPLLSAYTPGSRTRISQRDLCFIILAGPVPGVIIGSFLLYMNRGLHDETVKMLANSFLIINLLNCLPFYPLDGGRMLETLFYREHHLLRQIFGILSLVTLVILLLIFFSPILLIIPVLIGFDLYNEQKHQKIREYLAQEGVSFRGEYNTLPDKNYWLIRDCLILSFPKKFASLTPGNYEYSMFEPVIIQQIISILQPDIKADLGIVGKLLLIIFYLLLFAIPVGLIYMYK